MNIQKNKFRYMISIITLIFMCTQIFAGYYTIPEYYQSETFNTYTSNDNLTTINPEVVYDSAYDDIEITPLDGGFMTSEEDFGKIKWSNPENIYEKPSYFKRLTSNDLESRFWNTYNSKQWDTKIYGNFTHPDSIDYYRTDSKDYTKHMLRVYPEADSTYKYEISNLPSGVYIKYVHTTNSITQQIPNIYEQKVITSEYNIETNSWNTKSIETLK